MKLQIASDLHLEFAENKIWLEKNPLIPKGEILILAGDIVVDKHKRKAKSFYENIRNNFQKIIQIPGNHEFYSGEISYAYPNYYKELSENHIKANNKSIIIGNKKFIVSTLWSFIPPEDEEEVEKVMNDFRLIYLKEGYEKIPISVKNVNNYFKNSLKFIEKELEKEFDGEIIVVTHHLPSKKCISERNKNSPVNSAFATDLDDFIEKNPKIKLWIHGHSHEFSDITIGKTRVVRNPLGYLLENDEKDFKRDFTIEI